MHSFPARTANSYYTLSIRPALASFVDEVCGTLARLCAYLMTLALMAICGIALWHHLPDVTAMETSPKIWNHAGRIAPAFAVSQIIFPGKTETYEIHRHPEGGRKDVFRWSGIGGAPVAELEIYRPGEESDQRRLIDVSPRQMTRAVEIVEFVSEVAIEPVRVDVNEEFRKRANGYEQPG